MIVRYTIKPPYKDSRGQVSPLVTIQCEKLVSRMRIVWEGIKEYRIEHYTEWDFVYSVNGYPNGVMWDIPDKARGKWHKLRHPSVFYVCEY